MKIKQYSAALYLLDQMIQRNVPVNIFTFNIAINCVCRLNRVDFGFAILGTTLIDGLSKVGKISEAGKLNSLAANCPGKSVLGLVIEIDRLINFLGSVEIAVFRFLTSACRSVTKDRKQIDW